jgi:uncharacterized membrane protein YeaQ/YmgE (transglycosylase-associated protein family)
VILLALIAGAPALQIANGSFWGTVSDSSGGVIGSAKVNMTETTFWYSRESTTDTNSKCLLPSFNPGSKIT